MQPARRYRGVPTPLAILFGILIGTLLARYIPSFYSFGYSTSWRGSAHAPLHYPPRPSSSRPVPPPTLEQRRRVLDLLSTLSPHYTRECTRNLNPLYVQQARERYAPLIGHNPPPSKSWLFDLGVGDLDPIPRPSQEEASYYTHRRDLSAGEHKYFFAINLYNSFDVIPDLFAALFRVSAILGYHNVFVSIYENGSTDQTKALLRIFDALARSVGLRVTIRTSQRTRGAFNHRIEYLAEVRNAAFVPLHELRNAENEYFDTIVFMNDILPCVDDILELIYQSRLNNAGITCAADYMYHDDLVCSPPPVLCFWLILVGRVLRSFTIIGLRVISTVQPSKTRLSNLFSFMVPRLHSSRTTFPSRSSPVGTASPSWTPLPSTSQNTSASAWHASQTANVPPASALSSATTIGKLATGASSWCPV